MERLTTVGGSKIRSNLIGLDWGESLNTRLFEGVGCDRLVELSISCVRPVNRLEGNQFERIR